MAPLLQFLGLDEVRQAQYVSDLVPWQQLVVPGVLRNKVNGALMRAYRIRGRDLVAESPEVQGALMLQVNDVIKRLGGKWMVQSEAQRTPVVTYPVTEWTDPVAAVIDAERRHAILTAPGARETRYYLTWTWEPPTPTSHGLRRVFVRDVPDYATDETGDLHRFVSETDHLMLLLRGILAMSQACTTDELLTYLHTSVSDTWHPVRWSGHALDLDTQLCDRTWVPGWFPQLGSWHLRTCSFYSYPPMSHVGMMQYLESSPLDFRWCTRWCGLERAVQAHILRQQQHAWIQNEKHLAARMMESRSGREARIIESDSRNKAAQVDAARQELGADILAYGDFTSTITVWDAAPQAADEKLQQVQRAFEAQGFVLKHETVHAQEAWCSTHAGNRWSSVRKTKQSTIFLAHMLPGFQAAWTGPDEDTALGGPAWLYAHTDTSSLFRVVLHEPGHDVGHHLLLGPNGSGKSTMLSLGVAQWLKYRGARAAVFDVGRSARLITLLLRGQWIDLAAPAIPPQPLRSIDDPAERGWALGWLAEHCYAHGVPRDWYVTEFLGNRLTELALRPLHERTLSACVGLCEAQMRRTENRVSGGTRDVHGLAHPDPAKQARRSLQGAITGALRLLTAQGGHGNLLDGNSDPLEDCRVWTFEQETLLRYTAMKTPVIQYWFHALERQFSTERPLYVGMEEAALLAMQQLWRDKFDEYLMTSRKKGVSLGLVINSLRQSLTQGLGLLSEENCPTRFFFPNPAALEPHVAEVYEAFGIGAAERQLIAQAQHYRDVYYTHRTLGRRVFHLLLSPFVVDCVGRNTGADHVVINGLMQEYGRAGFPAAWLRHHGWEEAATTIEQCVTPGGAD